jgi:hypothetical protein
MDPSENTLSIVSTEEALVGVDESSTQKVGE